ncbi:MAG: patatin-like phospholipase family protein [Ferruginibacter sp.]
MKVLITSGGGAKGAFSVGALQYLLSDGGIAAFDLISGTSTGSLIAGMVGAGKVDTLLDVYLNTTNADVLKPVNLIDSLTQGKPFIFDTEPLMKQISTFMDAAAFKKIMKSNTTLCFNSVCLQTGRLSVFSTKPVMPDRHYDQFVIDDRDTLINAMLGSSNQAVFMNPVNINNQQFVDGGNKEVIPTRVVVNNLVKNEDHDIYILSNNPNDLVQIDKTFGDILSVLMRSISIFIQEVRENDLEVLATFKKISPSHVRIFYICPDDELDLDFPTGLRFDNVRMQKWVTMGKRKAKKVLGDFPQGNLG